jgi:ankyrin repeat protein
MKDNIMPEKPRYYNDYDAIVTAAYDGDFDTVLQLIQNGISPNIRNEAGETAIIVSAENGFDPIIELLLENGADINATDNDGDSALDIAKYHNNKSTITLLKKLNAKCKNELSTKEIQMNKYYDECENINAVKKIKN